MCGCPDKACKRCKGCPNNRKVRVRLTKKGKLEMLGLAGQPGRHLLGSSAPALAAGDISSSELQGQLGSALSGRTLLQSDDLVCDGQVNQLVIPRPPYPSFPQDTPYNSPASLSCSQPGGIGCGNFRFVRCGNISNIGPVSFGSRFLALPPDTPLRFTTNGTKYLTFVQWTVYDVGTGGARITGNYPAASGLGPVVTNHTWEAPPVNVGDECGACTNCEEGKGIKTLSVSAQTGVGFRSFDLSQVSDSPRCGASCFDLDASYWLGMTYSCVEPTCGDINLEQVGPNPFQCPTDFLPNSNASSSTIINLETCCTPDPRCGSTVPGSDPAVPFTCDNATSEYDSTKDDVRPPSQQGCCKPRTCGDINPISKPNTSYTCPTDFTFNTNASSSTNISDDTCCVPDVGPGTSYATQIINGKRTQCFKDPGTTCAGTNNNWGFYVAPVQAGRTIKLITGGGNDCSKGTEVGTASLVCNANTAGVPTSLRISVTNWAASAPADQHYYVGCRPVTSCSPPDFGATSRAAACTIGATVTIRGVSTRVTSCGGSFPTTTYTNTAGTTTQTFIVPVSSSTPRVCNSCNDVVWVVHQSGTYKGDPSLGQCS
eukprot:gene6577-6805_t